MTNRLPHIITLSFMTAICCVLPSWAVLPEENIDRTIIMLLADMQVLERNISDDLRRFENRQDELQTRLKELTEKCDETAIVLYSQDERYLYGRLMATQGMKGVIEEIRELHSGISQLESDLATISSRYCELCQFLKSIEGRDLSPAARDALNSSRQITDSLHWNIKQLLLSLDKVKSEYKELGGNADKLDDYGKTVMSRLQNEIFLIGNETIDEIFAHLPYRLLEFANDLQWRFFTGQSNSNDWRSQQERFNSLLDINNCIAFFAAVGFFFIQKCKRLSCRLKKGRRLFNALSLGLLIKVLGLAVIRLIVGSGYQFNITLMIDGELSLLALLIAASATLSLPQKQAARSIVSYLPTYCTTFLLLAFREGLVPMSTITLTTPLILTFSVISQMSLMIAGFRKIGKFDKAMAWGNLINLFIALVVTLCGYTVLSTIIFLLWIGLETGLLILNLAKSFLSKHNPDPTSVAAITLRIFVYPITLPVILLLSFVWVAHVYNLSLWLGELLATPFIDMPDKIGVISVAKLILIYGMGIGVNYIVTLTKTLLYRKNEYRQGRIAVAISVGSIIIWLMYIVGILIILDINKAGLIAVVGGASVGVGFALKDTFENLFYGMSLMAGRLRPGDILEYEGIRGKVIKIGIISTQMATEDGPLMTMPNRHLFEKNFKNMTRNSHVELRHISFDISADNDPKFVRQLILNCFKHIDGVDNSRKHVVIIRNFGSGVMRVELKVWIDSEKYLTTEPAVREAVFESFLANNIREATFIGQVEAKGAANIMSNNRTII